MGAIESSTAPPESRATAHIKSEPQTLSKITQNVPHSEVMSLAKQIQRYDSCGIGYSRIKSENYSLAERTWELSNPYELAHLACFHNLPQVRLYAFEGICVLLKTMKNFGHSPYWRFRFQPTEANVEELEDILYCTLVQLQSDHETAVSMFGCTVSKCSVSAVAKRLGWALLPQQRQQILEDMIIQARPESPEAEQILKGRAETARTLETYLILERQLESKPHLLQYIALFKKPRDIDLIIKYLNSDKAELVCGGIKAVSVWQEKSFWSVVRRLHSHHCEKLREYLLLTENHDIIMLFFAIHEAIVAYDVPEAVECLQMSYTTICEALKNQNPRLLHVTLSGLYNVIPVSLKYAELLFTLWKDHSIIKAPVLELLLDVSGEEKKFIREKWYAFLMGTHPRLGEESPVRILTRQLDVLDLIFEEFDSFRKRSVSFLLDINNIIWQRGTGKHFDKGLFCIAMGVLLEEAPTDIVCSILEYCVRSCTCRDACFVCEYVARVERPSESLITILLEQATHWNFYVHDPARMALLCFNDPVIDQKLEDILSQTVRSLSVYKPVTEGCDDGTRRWRSFM